MARAARWHERSFENLDVDDTIDFFDVGVNPNEDRKAQPLWGGNVRIYTKAERVKGNDPESTGLKVLAGSQGLRVFSARHQAWIRAGRHRS